MQFTLCFIIVLLGVALVTVPVHGDKKNDYEHGDGYSSESKSHGDDSHSSPEPKSHGGDDRSRSRSPHGGDDRSGSRSPHGSDDRSGSRSPHEDDDRSGSRSPHGDDDQSRPLSKSHGEGYQPLSKSHGVGYQSSSLSKSHGDGYQPSALHRDNYGQYDPHYGYNYGGKKVVCPDLPSPHYGDVKIIGPYPKQKAIYTCKYGHKLLGTATRECLPDGRWTGDEPICKPIDCGKLHDIKYGRVTVSPHSKVGGIATYSCDKYYKLVGNTKRKCLYSGKWDGKEPECVHDYYEPEKKPSYEYKEVRCPDLYPPKYGYVKVSGEYRHQKAVYTCKPGYVLVGPSIRKCLPYGKWIGEAPICKPINCGPLPDIANGAVDVKPDTRLGSTATYSCNKGYILSGYSTRKCQANGKWSNQEPTCKPVNCGPLSDPPNGDVQTSPDTLLNAVAIYTCRLGYKLKGVERRFCQANSKWSDNPPTCEKISCGQPQASDPNGNVNVRGTQLFDTATYYCNSGYFLRGTKTVFCQRDGKWSDRAPVCRPVDCGAPDPADPNGSMKVTGTTLGKTTIYSCNTGFELNGKSIATCLPSGKWSSDAPICDPVDCGKLPAPKYGQVFTPYGTTFNAIATFACDPGLRLVGSKTRKCQANGKWSGNQPVCKKTLCPKIKPPHYGKIYTSGYYPGGYAIVKCMYGYKLVGKSRLSCLHNGYWSGPPGKCVKDTSIYYPDNQYYVPPSYEKYE